MLLYGTGAAAEPSDAITEALDNLNAAADEHGVRLISISHDLTLLPPTQAHTSTLAKAFGGRERTDAEPIAYASVTAIGVEPNSPGDNAPGQWWNS